MTNKKYLTILLAFGALLSSYAGATDLTGAWKGPKDLMINVCQDTLNQPYICNFSGAGASTTTRRPPTEVTTQSPAQSTR